MLRFFDFLRPPRLLPAALFAVCMLSAPAVYCQPALYCDQAVRLLSIDNTGFDNFGSSVDVDGDFAVVGARAHATAAGMTGAAHIFVRSGGSWVEDAKLTPSDGVAGDLFGQSVAISGDTAVVGAFWHATNVFSPARPTSTCATRSEAAGLKSRSCFRPRSVRATSSDGTWRSTAIRSP